MQKQKVGFVGWRGMVGSVLMQRMQMEADFADIEAFFFSTSQAGLEAPAYAQEKHILDAFDITQLKNMDIIISCQGGEYTERIFPPLRASWSGYWIDAASTLRMQDDAIIILDPVNRHVIDDGIKKGIKNYVGGNCTVSLMMLALNGLLQQNRIEWISAMTYQAASGAGAQNMRELLTQMGYIHNAAQPLLADPASAILAIDQKVSGALQDTDFPSQHFGAALAGSLIPWIDQDLGNGQSREEWKGHAETNKILNNADPVIVDGLCVRIGAMRCHSQALTIKLRENIALDEIESMLAAGNQWVQVIPNSRQATIAALTPAAVTGTLSIPIGRIRKMAMGEQYLSAFTIGDQLLWGAAEPLRRMLRILVAHH